LNKLILITARVALAACALFTAWGAFAPPHSNHPHLFPWDKAEHFSAFFALTACSLAAFPRVRIVWIAAALSACGAMIEVIQALPFVNRDSDVKDWVADTVAILAVVGVVIVARVRRELSSSQ
jgi:VanZ family protein